MASGKCGSCKHFNDDLSHYPEWCGWCGLELPPWLEKAVPEPENKMVRKDDTCSFYKKGYE